MITAWRLVRAEHAADAFSGEGARLYGGRWNSPGRVVVYTCGHFATSVLEIMVHFRPLPATVEWMAVSCEFPETLVEQVEPADLPRDWRRVPPGPSTQDLGDAWLRGARSAVLAVPSAITPVETNYLLNPAHPDFARIRRTPPEPFDPDLRLTGR